MLIVPKNHVGIVTLVSQVEDWLNKDHNGRDNKSQETFH